MQNGNIFLRFPEGKAKALTFSYDDGVFNDIRLCEIFKKYNMKATFNLNGGLFGEKGKTDSSTRLTEETVKELYSNDLFEVACHGFTHPWLNKCAEAVAFNEMVHDRLALEKVFDKEVHGFAYPYGTYNATTLEVLKSAGIYYGRTTASHLNFSLPSDWLTWHPTCHHKNAKLSELADKMLSTEHIERDPWLFYVWGHSYEFGPEYDNNWEVIESFCEKMAGKDDIWYATNMEIYRYCRSFSRLMFSADGHLVYNPTADKIWFTTREGKMYTVESGETINLRDGE